MISIYILVKYREYWVIWNLMLMSKRVHLLNVLFSSMTWPKYIINKKWTIINHHIILVVNDWLSGCIVYTRARTCTETSSQMIAHFCFLNRSELKTKSNPTLHYPHTHRIPVRVYNTQDYVVISISNCNLIWQRFR